MSARVLVRVMVTAVAAATATSSAAGRGKRPVTVHRSRTSNDVLFANAPAAQGAASAASPDDRVVVEIGHQDAHSASVGYPVPLAYVDEHGKLIDRRYALHGIHLDMTIFVQN